MTVSLCDSSVAEQVALEFQSGSAESSTVGALESLVVTSAEARSVTLLVGGHESLTNGKRHSSSKLRKAKSLLL